MSNEINLGIIEDEPMVMSNLKEFFNVMPDFKLNLAETSVEAFLENLTPNIQVDTMLLDIGLPGMSGLEGIRPIREKRPNVNILMLTAYDDPDRIFKALCAGADSYISKKTDLHTIREAILTVSRGGAFMSPIIARKVINHFSVNKEKDKSQILTPRQRQIVEGLVEGLSYKLIADKLLISVETVRDHIKKIYKKLQVNSKAEVIKKWMDKEI